MAGIVPMSFEDMKTIIFQHFGANVEDMHLLYQMIAAELNNNCRIR